MSEQITVKKREIFFYLMSVERKKNGTDETPYSIDAVITAMANKHGGHGAAANSKDTGAGQGIDAERSRAEQGAEVRQKKLP